MPKDFKTPNYIQSLLIPNTKSPQGRRVWSIDLETVWLPFFTATNAMGDTALPLDAIGCPIRLGYDKDGSVKFSKNGRPVTRVAKPLQDSVTLIRQNFVANLQQYAERVATQKTDDYSQVVKMADIAGQPIRSFDRAELDKAVALQLEEAMRLAGEATQEATEEATEEATQEATEEATEEVKEAVLAVS